MFQEAFHFALINGVRLASAILPAAPLLGQKPPAAPGVKNMVLVHGALADGLSLQVTPLLQGLGYLAVAVQNPMTSLADEVAFTRRPRCRWSSWKSRKEALGNATAVGHRV